MRKRYGSQFKAKVALAALKGEKTAAELSSHYGLHSSQIVRWKKQLEQSAPDIFSGKQEKAAQDGQRLKDELYRQIGQLKVELDWVKKKSGLDG